MTSTQLAAILATVGLAFLAQALACAALFVRVRSLTRRMARPAPPPTAPGHLTDQIRALEARLARLELGPVERGRDATPPADSRRTRRLDRRQVASADGPVLIAVPSLALPPAITSTLAAAAEFDRRFGAIWALADAGALDDEIARQTGYPVGQVELIRGLRGPKVGGEPTPARLDPPRDATDA